MTQRKQNQPRAILISDIHYRLDTLELADTALRMAITAAHEFKVPLIVCGDTNDTKALLRAEVANALIATLEGAPRSVKVHILVGNHDRLHEKAPAHSLEFLKPYANVVDEYRVIAGMHCIPYQSTPEDFLTILNRIPKGSQLIIHQGVIGAQMGHYFQDHSAISSQALDHYQSAGGHYHNHHTSGNHTFIGNPYTLTFGEVNDLPKGYCILMDDGSLHRVPTNLRKHIVVERDLTSINNPITGYNPGDLLWLKVTGPSLELDKLSRAEVAENWRISESFKFDKIPTDSAKVVQLEVKQTHSELMDILIDASGEAESQCTALKALYREIMK